MEGKDPAVVHKVLQFLYNGNYEDEEYPNMESPSPLVYWSPQEIDEELRKYKCASQDSVMQDPLACSKSPYLSFTRHLADPPHG